MNLTVVDTGVQITLPDTLRVFGLAGKRVTFTHPPRSKPNTFTYKHVFKYDEAPNLEIVVPNLVRAGAKADAIISYMFACVKRDKELWLTRGGVTIMKKDSLTGGWAIGMGTKMADLSDDDLKVLIDECVNRQNKVNETLELSITMRINLHDIVEPESDIAHTTK